MDDRFSQFPFLADDDGLLLPEVGSWAEGKHDKVGYYAEIFASSMKQRWDCRVYIDLFAGAGKARLRDSGKIVPGSPLVALTVSQQFDRYYFCEMDEDAVNALSARVSFGFSNSNTTIFNIDSNVQIDELLTAIPKFHRGHTGLTLCFVDPYKAKNLHFDTLRRLSEKIRVDFIVLIPTSMDINRNEHNYTRVDDSTIDNFLGTNQWRDAWRREAGDFGIFVANQFGLQMERLGYKYNGLGDFESVRVGDNNGIYLYHLGFFSKHSLGHRFWQDTRRNTTRQIQLF